MANIRSVSARRVASAEVQDGPSESSSQAPMCGHGWPPVADGDSVAAEPTRLCRSAELSMSGGPGWTERIIESVLVAGGGDKPLEPALLLQLEMELEQVVVGDRVARAGLLQLGRHVPHGQAD